MIKQLTNSDKNFYKFLGPIFGSRIVERKTKDRFYDDDNKLWYLYLNKGTSDTFVSVKDNIIKNVWTENKDHLINVLKVLYPITHISIVPGIFKEEFEACDFNIVEETGNFIHVLGGLTDEKN